MPASAVSFAVAEPSVETWLLSDPTVLAAGLTDALGRPAAGTTSRARPRSEREAKAALGRAIHDLLGESLPLAGFEYASEVVAHLALQDADDRSLSEWAREFVAIVLSRSSRAGACPVGCSGW